MSRLYKSKNYALALVAALFFTGLGYYLSSFNNNFNVLATFNKGKAISEFAKELTKVKLSSQKQSVLIKKFSIAMSDVLSDESKKRHITIVSSKLIIAGGYDLTDELLPIIASRIKTVIKSGGKL